MTPRPEFSLSGCLLLAAVLGLAVALLMAPVVLLLKWAFG